MANNSPSILLHVILLPIIPVATLAWILLWIFRQGVGLWLRIKLGHQFGGLLSSADKVYMPTSDMSRKVILTVSYIKTEERTDVMARFAQRIKEKVLNHPNDYPKLLSTHHSFLGHDYLLNNQIELSDILKPIPLPAEENVAFNEEYLKRWCGTISNNPLPKNDTALVEAFVATEPLVNVHPSIKGYVYPLLTRFHHGVADGIRLMAFFSKVFGDTFETNYIEKIMLQKSRRKSYLDQLLSKAKYIVYCLYLILIGIGSYLRSTFLKDYKLNAIHGPTLSGKKIIAWATEYDSRLVTTVKKTKNRIPNTRFSDVVFTCVSASLSNYFKKINADVPEEILCLIPVLFAYPPPESSKPIDLKNEFSFAKLEMPIVDASNILQGLEKIKIRMEEMRRDPVNHVSYWLINHLSGVIPGKMLKMLINTRPFCCAISSVPGIGNMKLLGGELQANISCAPHPNQTGITITITTFDDKFNVCLFVDKVLISKQEDAQYIVNEILRNMEVLSEESMKIYS